MGVDGCIYGIPNGADEVIVLKGPPLVAAWQHRRTVHSWLLVFAAASQSTVSACVPADRARQPIERT